MVSIVFDLRVNGNSISLGGGRGVEIAMASQVRMPYNHGPKEMGAGSRAKTLPAR
jgi:hypothetical protein